MLQIAGGILIAVAIMVLASVALPGIRLFQKILKTPVITDRKAPSSLK
jgi:hypothetical protein